MDPQCIEIAIHEGTHLRPDSFFEIHLDFSCFGILYCCYASGANRILIVV